MTDLESIYDLLTEGKISPSVAAVYRALVSRRRRSDMSAWPSIATLRKDTGSRFTERTVQRALRRLEDLGFIVTTPWHLSYPDPKYGASLRRGRQTSNVYRLTDQEERAELVKKGRGEDPRLPAPTLHPMGDNDVTPSVGTSEDRRLEQTPHVPPLQRDGRPPKRPPGRKTAKAPRLHPDMSRVLTWWRAEERKRLPGKEPSALPTCVVEGVDAILRIHGPASTLAVLRLYRAPDFSWSEWAQGAGFPLGRLGGPKGIQLVRTIMAQRAFSAVRRRFEVELAADAAAMLRSNSIGAALASVLGGPAPPT